MSELSGAGQPARRATLQAFQEGERLANRRLSVRKIREVLRLYFAAALSVRAIARSLGVSPSTVGDYLRRAEVAGLEWPLPDSVDDAGLERRLFPAPPPSGTSRPLPAWSEVHQELRRKGVTLSLLWQEYKGDPTRRGCNTAASASSIGRGRRSSTS